LSHAGERLVIDAGFVIGCDGFHGISRPAIPASARRDYQRSDPDGIHAALPGEPGLSTLATDYTRSRRSLNTRRRGNF
jgi:2-polyprenyl-6-methoxyphenol hydroxylase-like FAD-dependent oxidoreductase